MNLQSIGVYISRTIVSIRLHSESDGYNLILYVVEKFNGINLFVKSDSSC